MSSRRDEFPAAGDGGTPTPQPPRDPGAGLPDPKKIGNAKFAVDVLERAFATYLEVFLGLLVASDKLNISYVTAAAVAAVPTGLAVLKAGLARFLGDKKSAAFIPRRFLRRDFHKAA
jgi:hypothetical protein